MRKIGLSKCPYCGNAEIYSSRRATWRDEVRGEFFLQVVRCHSCMRRHYRPLFIPHVPGSSEKKPILSMNGDEKNERSA